MAIALLDRPGPIDDDITRSKLVIGSASLALLAACAIAAADPAPGR